MYPTVPQFDLSKHVCLVLLRDKYAYPFVYAEARDASGNVVAARWLVKLANLTKQGRLDHETETLQAITFCPICGMMLTIGSAEGLIPQPAQAPAPPAESLVEEGALEEEIEDLDRKAGGAT